MKKVGLLTDDDVDDLGLRPYFQNDQLRTRVRRGVQQLVGQVVNILDNVDVGYINLILRRPVLSLRLRLWIFSFLLNLQVLL